MAYCKKCGAYIPDGLSACLACGFDENLTEKENTAAKTQNSNDVIRERLEEQRRARQEENRRWAEQEESRRRQQEQSRQWAEQERDRRQQQEQSRQWAEQEFARRQAERENAARNYTYRTTMNRANAQSGEGNKLFAALSYLSFLFVLPYFVTPEDEFAKYHAKQGMKLFLAGLIGRIAGSIIGLGWLATLAQIYLAYVGIKNVLDGKRKPLPYIGDWFK